MVAAPIFRTGNSFQSYSSAFATLLSLMLILLNKRYALVRLVYLNFIFSGRKKAPTAFFYLDVETVEALGMLQGGNPQHSYNP